MKKEVEFIRYLLDEIDEQLAVIAEWHDMSDEECIQKYGWRKAYCKPQKQLIVDNAKKIRKLASKIVKQGGVCV